MCRPFQNSGPPCLHHISASPGDFRNTTVRFPRHFNMSAQPSCLVTARKLSLLAYVSSLGTVTLGLSAFVTSWLHWESCRHSLTKYWQWRAWTEATVWFVSTNSQGELSQALKSDHGSCRWPIPGLHCPRADASDLLMHSFQAAIVFNAQLS